MRSLHRGDHRCHCVPCGRLSRFDAVDFRSFDGPTGQVAAAFTKFCMGIGLLPGGVGVEVTISNTYNVKVVSGEGGRGTAAY